MNLKSLKGRSLPSVKHGAWIVDEVSKTIEGRSRLVTANLKGEQWVWTYKLVDMFGLLDEQTHLDTALNRKLRAEL